MVCALSKKLCLCRLLAASRYVVSGGANRGQILVKPSGHLSVLPVQVYSQDADPNAGSERRDVEFDDRQGSRPEL